MLDRKTFAVSDSTGDSRRTQEDAFDQRDMHRMGRKQELRREFHFYSIWGYAIVLCCSWEFSLIGILFIPNGGTGGAIWNSIASCIGMFFVTMSMAEMASMAPSAGGQYAWTSEFAPKKYQKFLSYYVGFYSILGWQAGVAANCYIVAQQINAIIVVTNNDFVMTGWQLTLISWAVMGLSIMCNTVGFRKLPLMEGIFLLFHVLGFLAIIIVLWVMAPRGGANTFISFEANGWPSAGLACLVGLNAAIGPIIGADSSVHMSEELKNAAWVLPRSMVAAALVNYSLAILATVSIAFCLGDFDEVVGTKTGQPYVQVILNATRSVPATVVLTATVTILLTAGAVNYTATSSRQLWAFARDGAVPFSRWVSAVRPGWDVPVNALTLTAAFTVIVTCIAIGSTTAYDIFLTLGLTGLLSSYVICISCILYRRLQSKPLPPSRFDLGRAGVPINVIALAFLTVVWVFQFFPFAPNPTPAGMNWSIVIYAAFVLFFSTFYLRARKRYTAPVRRLRDDV